MIDAAKAAGVVLVVGHSHSFNAPVLRTRALIESGAYGKPRMISALNFTDFLYRPRRPEELDTARGGGVIFSQAAHQIDIVRLFGGGRVTERARRDRIVGRGAADRRRLFGVAHIRGRRVASVVYSGYAHFDSDELNGWIGEMGLPKDRSRYGAARKALQRINAGTGNGAESRAQFRRQGLCALADRSRRNAAASAFRIHGGVAASAPICARSPMAS